MRVPSSSGWLAVLLAAACASDPVPGGGERPSTDPVVVRLLGDGFVEADGVRQPLEDLVYELRVRCRRAAAAGSDERPWLRVVAPADGPDDLRELADRLRRAAHDAGVRHVELQLGDA